MKKTNKFFLILGIVYLIIVLLAVIGEIILDNDVLAGLALSSLFIATGGLIDKVAQYIIITNEYKYYIKVTSEFLKIKIDNKIKALNDFDECNIKRNIDDLCKNVDRSVNPGKYTNSKAIKIMSICSFILFCFGIVAFISIPFVEVNENIFLATNFITVLAFAVICFEYYVDDLYNDTGEKIARFKLDKQVIVNLAYPDYLYSFDQQVYHSIAYENKTVS